MKDNPCEFCNFRLIERDSIFEKCTISGECPHKFDSKIELEEQDE